MSCDILHAWWLIQSRLKILLPSLIASRINITFWPRWRPRWKVTFQRMTDQFLKLKTDRAQLINDPTTHEDLTLLNFYHRHSLKTDLKCRTIFQHQKRTPGFRTLLFVSDKITSECSPELRRKELLSKLIKKRLFQCNWAGPWENGSYVICEQQRRRSACASAQSDQHLYCSLLRQCNISRFYSWNFKTLASFCRCAGRFVSGLVGNSRRHVISWRGSIVVVRLLKKLFACLSNYS